MSKYTVKVFSNSGQRVLDQYVDGWEFGNTVNNQSKLTLRADDGKSHYIWVPTNFLVSMKEV